MFQESIESRLSLTDGDASSQMEQLRLSEGRQDTLTLEAAADTVDGVVVSTEAGDLDEDPDDGLCDSLDIWCPRRIANTEAALADVEGLLNRVDDCEKLFPSSRILVADNQAWTDEEFKVQP